MELKQDQSITNHKQDENESMNSSSNSSKNAQENKAKQAPQIEQISKPAPKKTTSSGTCFHQDKYLVGQPQFTEHKFMVQEISKEILKQPEDKQQLYDKINEALRNEPKYRPDHDFLDVLNRDFLNDRLIPDHDSETDVLVLQILSDFLYQLSKINNCKARYQVSEMINGAIIKKKEQIAEYQSQMEKPFTNLTFNYKIYNDYVRKTAEMQVDGDTNQDHFVTLLDYMVNPCIPVKNYVVIGDIQCGLQKLQSHEEMLPILQRKLDYLKEHRYPVETRLDNDTVPMTELEIQQYTQQFSKLSEAYKKNPIVVESSSKPGKYKEWYIHMNDNKMPALNKLSGFQSVLKDMVPSTQELYAEGIEQNDKAKQAEFIISYTKELFWVFQAFLSSRLKQLKSVLTASKMNENKTELQQMDEPFSIQDSFQVEVIVNSADKIYAAFENLAKFKQIQIVQVKPEFNGHKKQVTVDFVFAKKIVGKCCIRLQSFTIYERQNKILQKLVHSENYAQFKSHILDELCQLTSKGNMYMPYYNPQTWKTHMNELKNTYLQEKSLLNSSDNETQNPVQNE